MPQSRLAAHLTRVNFRAASQLDAVAKHLPQQRQPGAFEAYIQQAQAQAARDPAFAVELHKALAQHKALGGGI